MCFTSILFQISSTPAVMGTRPTSQDQDRIRLVWDRSCNKTKVSDHITAHRGRISSAGLQVATSLTRQIRRPAHLLGWCQASTHLCTSLCLQQAKPANTCLQRDSDKHITNMQEGALDICRGAALRDTATARCSFFREPGNIARHRHPRCSIRPCWPLLNHGCKQWRHVADQPIASCYLPSTSTGRRQLYEKFHSHTRPCTDPSQLRTAWLLRTVLPFTVNFPDRGCVGRPT